MGIADHESFISIDSDTSSLQETNIIGSMFSPVSELITTVSTPVMSPEEMIKILLSNPKSKLYLQQQLSASIGNPRGSGEEKCVRTTTPVD